MQKLPIKVQLFNRGLLVCTGAVCQGQGGTLTARWCGLSKMLLVLLYMAPVGSRSCATVFHLPLTSPFAERHRIVKMAYSALHRSRHIGDINTPHNLASHAQLTSSASASVPVVASVFSLLCDAFTALAVV